MKVLIAAGIVIVPFSMVIIERFWYKGRFLFNCLAYVAFVIFGFIASSAIHTILRDQEVFMTSIHGIFLNTWFLVTGAYIGWYTLYSVLLVTLAEHPKNKEIRT
ncbi:transposase [Alkalihalophilus marmarensis]|uniref:transposase n=1 Tax=Alkalihalophilus marmarensis TaxID=521377 RepID=UPI002DBD5A1E|nr:transposase [Alkalihalophilus marmarensis]MEC2073393.1 transposase [Alkalihalophilus marmarensis]